jgi:hypothetical protein
MLRSAAGAALALALLLLAGCAGTPIVSSYNLVTPPPRLYELAAAVGGRAVPVAVTSSPFPGLGPQPLAAILVGLMPPLCGAHYVPAAAPGASGMIWSFAAAQTMTADLALIAPPRGKLSEMQGEVSGVQTPQDPAFAALVRQMTIAALQPCL